MSKSFYKRAWTHMIASTLSKEVVMALVGLPSSSNLGP